VNQIKSINMKNKKSKTPYLHLPQVNHLHPALKKQVLQQVKQGGLRALSRSGGFVAWPPSAESNDATTYGTYGDKAA
jgi:hypothetical protein